MVLAGGGARRATTELNVVAQAEGDHHGLQQQAQQGYRQADQQIHEHGMSSRGFLPRWSIR